MTREFQIGLLVFPDITQIDFTGPLQVFSLLPGAKVHLVWKNVGPVPNRSVLTIMPTTSFADCPQLDVVCVPGGNGTNDLVNDPEVLDFLRKQAKGARFITSVCTGSLVLGAAGLLKGYKASTHWIARDLLPAFGATTSLDRVCIDRNRITGGGATAGIDFALTLVSKLVDRATAESIQLRLEYDPCPPFDAGTPETASPAILAEVTEAMSAGQVHRLSSTKEAASRVR